MGRYMGVRPDGSFIAYDLSSEIKEKVQAELEREAGAAPSGAAG
jgi:hypothetical protein